jgi:hypothetical protein
LIAARHGKAGCVRPDGSLIEFATVPLPDGGTLVSYIDVTDKARVENGPAGEKRRT